MEHDIKHLSEAMTHLPTRHLIRAHVKEVSFSEKTRHLVLYLDNSAPLHELESPEGEEHLRRGLEKVYGEYITYEMRLRGHPSKPDRKQSIRYQIRKLKLKEEEFRR